MQKLYAIYDNVAKDFVGPIQLFRADPPAIRMFGEFVNMKNYAPHARDFDLIVIGHLDEEMHIREAPDNVLNDHNNALIVQHEMIMSGANMVAAQQQAMENNG